MDPNYLIVRPVELGGPLSPGLLLKNVYALYGSQFRRWFVITAPTSLLASVVLLMSDQKIRAIYRTIPRGEIPYHLGAIAETGVLRFGGFFIAWLLGCFALGAIATVVNGLDVDEGDSVWRRDSYQRSREHFIQIFLVAVVTFCAFLLGMLVNELVDFAFARLVGWARFSRFIYGATLVGYIVIASVISWLGMAIPIILREKTKVWDALKKSVSASNGYEGFLLLLVLESTLGSYVGWYAVHSGLTFLFPPHLRYTHWYGWVVYCVAILASAAVQPPMFIGFSLLASSGLPIQDSLHTPNTRRTSTNWPKW